jgi:PAS domain S-box-containing protein
MTSAINVLHVDDDREFASLTAAYLEEEHEGFTVESEPDAMRALARLEDERFDCVVSDYEMPQITGLEFLRKAREIDSDLPIIFFTGRGSEDVASEAISAGVTDYLQKRGHEQYTLLGNRIKNYVAKRRAEEERLRGYEAIERAREGISILDGDGRFVYTNQAFASLLGYDRDELLGQHWELLYREEDREHVYEEQLPAATDGGWTGRTVFRRKDGDLVLTNHSLSYTDEGELISVAQDITDDERRRRELLETRRFESLVRAVTEYAVCMLDTEGRVVTWNEGAGEITGYSEEAITGEHVSRLHTTEAVATGLVDDLLSEALATGRAEDQGWRVRNDDRRFWAHDVVTPVYDDDGTHQGFALVTRDMTERRAREQELTSQRESLAAANRMNAVLRDVLRRMVHDSSRTDIERDVCDRLTAEGPYAFAASCDYGAGGLAVRLSSGIDAEAAEYVFDHVATNAAVGRAVDGGTVEVQHVDSEAIDLDHELGAAIRSVVYVPVTYRDTTYGVVALCSTSASHLTDGERDALEDVGAAAGYGIHAVETERLLQADGVVELVFETSDADDPLVGLVSAGGTAQLDRLLPVDDGQYLVYATLDGVSPAGAITAVASNPAVVDATAVHEDDDGDGGVVALTVSESLVGHLADAGAKVHTTDGSDGSLRVVVDVSPTADIGRLVDGAVEAFAGTRLVSKRQVARPVKRTRAVAETVESRLTERQLSALQAAYHGGYFERPRRQTAEDVAETMGISASTFHQHLRIALETVLTELFD